MCHKLVLLKLHTNALIVFLTDKEKIARAIETYTQRTNRLAKDQEYTFQVRAIGSNYQRASRKSNYQRDAKKQHTIRQNKSVRNVAFAPSGNAREFRKVINNFCCDICTKRCYANQVVKYHMIAAKSYLPPERSKIDVQKGLVNVVIGNIT